MRTIELFQLFGSVFIKDNDVKKKLDEIDGQAKKTGSGVTNLDNNFDKFGNTLGKIGKAAEITGKAMAGAAVAAGAAAIKLGIDVVKQFGELEQNLGGSEAVFGQYAASIQKTGEDAYKNLGVSQSEYLATANKMGALFQGSGVEQQKSLELTEKAMQRAADMASVMGIDMQVALDSVAGAAKGNFTMMDNLGVAMNATNIEAYALAKGLDFTWASATQAEKAEVAMQMFFENTQQYAGNFARESTQTISGSIGLLKAALGSFTAGLGNANADMTNLTGNLVAAFGSVVENIMPVLDNIIAALPMAMDAILKAIADLLPTLLGTATTLFSQVLNTIMQLLPKLIPAAVEAMITITKALVDNLPLLIDAALQMILALALGLANALPELIPTIVDVVLKIIDTLIDNIDMLIDAGIELMLGLLEGIINALPRIIEKLPEILVKLTDAIIRNAPKFLEAGMRLFEMLMEGITKVAISSVAAVGKLINDYTIQPIKDKIKEFTEAGKNLLEGLWKGIGDKVDWLKGKVKGVVNKIKSWFTGKEGFDEASPSKWAREVMKFVMDGLGLGVEDGELPLMEKTKKMLGNLKTFISSTLSSMGIFSENTQLKYDLWGLTDGKNASETDKLDKKLENLTKQQEEQSEVVEVLNLAYEEAVKLYGENSVESVELENQLLKEKIAYENLSKAIYEVVEAKQKLIQDSQPKVEEPKPLANSNPSGFAEAYANFEKLLEFGYSKEDQMAYAMQYASASGKGFDFVPANNVSTGNKGSQNINLTMGDIVIHGNADRDTVSNIQNTVSDAFNQFVGQLQQTAMINRAV